MNVEEITDYCMEKPNVTSGFPFGGDVLVFKKSDKMFCLLVLDKQPVTFNVKCEPERAMELREQYPAVLPGYHMDKKHWNTIVVDGTLSGNLLRSFIDDSYALIKVNK
jgi:predicted DNA-binding protein (MmcQ/YjbR family)